MPLPKAKVLRERVLTTKLREARRSGKLTPVVLTVLTYASAVLRPHRTLGSQCGLSRGSLYSRRRC